MEIVGESLKVGKLSGERLQGLILSKLGYRRSDVLVHAGLGEDSAIVDFGDEVCIVSTDPITGAAEGIGELAVHISCNDIAANGGHPVGVQVLLLLPEGTVDATIAHIMEEIAQTASLLQVEVLGGHTEITSKVSDVVVAVTAIGRAKKNAYVTSSGAKPGDSLVISKGVGIEGTAIILREFAEQFPDVQRHCVNEFLGNLSVVKEGLKAAEFGVHAMHDMTEGGLLGAATEMACASNVGIQIFEESVPISDVTKLVCERLKLDPLALLSSGSMLMAGPDGEGLVMCLQEAGVSAAIIGEVTAEQKYVVVRKNGERQNIPSFVPDELWRLYEC